MKFLFCLVTLSLLSSLCICYPRQQVVEDQVQDPSEHVRAQRQAGGHDHHDSVDFGAHTGEHGAFGWYADFPVLHHH